MSAFDAFGLPSGEQRGKYLRHQCGHDTAAAAGVRHHKYGSRKVDVIIPLHGRAIERRLTCNSAALDDCRRRR